jgi:ubiquinone/menaquinone biosynthesis C-methylase UbiE
MFSGILPYMRCTRCLNAGLHADVSGLVCTSCQARYPLRNGILDMVGEDPGEVITPFQRLMQTPAIVAVYEKLWRQAGYYLASSRLFGEEKRTVLRLRAGQSAERVLDLACGTGVFTRPLARHGQGLVVGLDLSWPMLRHARRLMEKEGIRNIRWIRGTAFCLPFVDAAFLYVNCCGALHLFDRPGAALDEIQRILDRTGHLCVQTTIRPERSAGMAYFLERFIRFGFFNQEELLEQLKLRGFSLVESERHRISFTFLAKLNP